MFHVFTSLVSLCGFEIIKKTCLGEDVKSGIYNIIIKIDSDFICSYIILIKILKYLMKKL